MNLIDKIPVLEQILDEDFSGVIRIRKKGADAFCRAYGYADKSNGLRNEIHTRFPIASGSKVFTAVAILQLVEKGGVQLDTTLGDIMSKELGIIDLSVTLHQLLTHTSGIPDYFDEDVMETYEELWADFPMYKIRKPADLLPLFIHKPMQYAPGLKFKYNNSGFVLLALVIEKLTGLSFDQYVQENILYPCEMMDTGHVELDRLPGR
ncbi:MAG: beta-lactamase family protein, partial [Clostridia bacterium]|nr:beta-lactamase family protein [Clostridia bacterium]